MSAISPTYGVGADQFTDEDMAIARRVVTSGAEVLDHYHQGLLDEQGYNSDARQWWVGKVDWDILFMHDQTRCVLGQIFGIYSQGIETLVSSPPIDAPVRVHNDSTADRADLVAMNVYWAVANGFFTCEDDDEAIPYGALEIAWIEVRDAAHR